MSDSERSQLEEELARVCRKAEERYGAAMVGLTVSRHLVMGFVAIPDQADQVREIVRRHRPTAEVRLLTLSERRPRIRVVPGAGPLEIWRRPRLDLGGGQPERTTQLLPGDPPAEVVAFRGASLLVRAPGEAIGWIDRDAGSREAHASAAADTPLLRRADEPGLTWNSQEVVDFALAQLGRPYVWGGTGWEGFDCSGLIWRAFLQRGVLLPKNSRRQRLVGSRIPRSEMRRGDLVAAVSRGPRAASHVALAVSATEVVHACSETHTVRRESMVEFEGRYRVLGLRRLAGDTSTSR